MDTINIQQTPCLVTTPQGVSVSYNNKFLYSKYDPQRAIKQIIDSINPLPGTIFLCISPVLPYGLKELSLKLPENCLLLGCENNKDLYNFIQDHIDDYKSIDNFTMLSPDELYNLPPLLAGPETKFKNGYNFPGAGKFRRVIPVDFSAGAQLNTQFYNQLSKACINAIKTFWSNRVTLSKFGRLYSKNFFKNLSIITKTTPITNYIGKISKPIIVCGAGESLDSGINDFKANRDFFFILCADTALQPLLKHKIVPDGVFIEEAQSVISKAFIGAIKHNIHIFAGLSSLPVISHNVDKSNISFFTTLYANTSFIQNMKAQNILPAVNKPFGSVGLTTVHYALQFRISADIPVYVYGLDFSYSAGRTHTQQAMAHTLRLCATNKIIPVSNYSSAWNKNTTPVQSKDNRTFYTTPTMQNYADLFNGIFYNETNLFDAADCGLKLDIPAAKPKPLSIEHNLSASTESFTNNYKEKVTAYLKNEKVQLTKLKDILTGKIKLPAEELEVEITKLAKPREYLYLHFPDGNQFTYSQSFLNRIRTEIEGFLKLL